MTQDDSWKKRGGKMQIYEQLPPLNLEKRYEFELLEVQTKDNQSTTYKGITKVVNKIVMVFIEAGKTKETGGHRVWVNVNESYTPKSKLVEYLVKFSGKQIPEAVDFTLGDFLYKGMKINALLKDRLNKDSKPTGYYDFITDTIKAGEIQQQIQQQAQQPAAFPVPSDTVGVSVENIKLIIKGAKEKDEGMMMLLEAKQSTATCQTYLIAVKNGKITFPV